MFRGPGFRFCFSVEKKEVTKSVYMVDILVHLNEFNKKIQSRNSNILILSDKIKSFCVKLVLHGMFKTVHFNNETPGAISRQN